MLTIELLPDHEQGGFTARVPDIPAYGEGETEEEAVADLREALVGYIETYGLDDALQRVNHPSLKTIDLETPRSIPRDIEMSPTEFEHKIAGN